jgi:hypothetical protein
MNKASMQILLIIPLIVLFSSGSASAKPTLKVTALVLDESRKPIRGANVKIWYMIPKSSGIGTDDRADQGKSDDQGLFSSSGESFTPQTTIDVRKEGYYDSGEIVKFTSRSLLNRWEPWNPTVEVVLKKKRNPVGMYMKGTSNLRIPKFNKPIGYDLEKGDWVSPYGKGLINDFIFTMNVVDRSYRDSTFGDTV